LKVLTQGWKALLGWQHPSQDKVQWVLQLASYSAIILFVFLLALSRWVLGKKAFEREAHTRGTVEGGKTPTTLPPPNVTVKWERGISAIGRFI
jgi:hypothetical protein